MREPQVLIPFDKREAITLNRAGSIANRTPETVRGWCANHDIGRKIGGQWLVSYPALLMFLESNWSALRAYLVGDRQSDSVAGYFRRAAVPMRDLRKAQELQNIQETQERP